MSRYIPDEIRKFVAKRAEYRCEYCRIHERHSFLTFHIEHIISLKHGGESVESNFAYACPICNINKGSDIATILIQKDHPIRFFNPRVDTWNDHFEVEISGLIIPRTDIGKATIKILDMNHPDSIIERREMLLKKLF